MSDQLHSHIRNITLLHISAKDVKTDCKLQNLNQDFEEIIDIYVFGDQEKQKDDSKPSDDNIDLQNYYNAFLEVLSFAKRNDIKDISVNSVLRYLDKETKAIEIRSDDYVSAYRG